jgi:hypothetical protein
MSKPKFDPNKPFEVLEEQPVAEAKPAFDPNAPYEAVSEQGPHVSASGAVSTGTSLPVPGIVRDIAEIGNDLGLGVAQGMTLGGADELEGGVRALGAKLTGDDKDLIELYRQYQDMAQTKYDQAGERSPWLYGAGNIIGGVVTTPILGGAGLMGNAGKVAIKEVMKQGGKTAVAKALGKAAVQDAVLAAPAGAAYGALSSNHDLIGTDQQEKKEWLKDVGTSAVMSGTIASTLGLTGNLAPVGVDFLKKGSGQLAEKMDDMPLIRLMRKAYKYGDEGVDLAKSETKEEFFTRAGRNADEIAEKFGIADEYFGKQVGQVIDDATAKGVQVDVGPVFKDLDIASIVADNPSIKWDPKVKKVLQGLVANQKAVLTPNQARALKDDLLKMMTHLDGDNSFLASQTKEAVADMVRGVDTTLKNAIPEYRLAAKKFAQNRSSTIEQAMSGHVPVEQSNIKYGKTKNADLKLRNKLEDLLQGATTEGSGNKGEVKGAYFLLKEKLRQLEKSNPEAFKAMGTNADDLIRSIRDKADDSALIQAYSQQNPRSTIPKDPASIVSSLGGSMNSKAIGFSNKMGLWKVPQKLENAALAAPRLTKKALFDMPLEGLSSIAGKFAAAENPQAKKFGEALMKAINNKDQVAKNATLFAIMQNPNLRQMLDLDDEDKK